MLHRKGRDAYHDYYLCQNRNCSSSGKSIRCEVMENDFEALLVTLKPSEELFSTACAMFEDIWNHQAEIGHERSRSLKAELAKMIKRCSDLWTGSLIRRIR